MSIRLCVIPESDRYAMSPVHTKFVLSRFTAFRRVVFGKQALISYFCFWAVLAIVGTLTSRAAVRRAHEALAAGASDMVDYLDRCVDPQLAFIAHNLAAFYGTPEQMSKADLRKIMKEYFLNEINVVDGTGLCLASTVPAICGSNMRVKSSPAAFCRALIDRDETAFSQPFRESATEKGFFCKYMGVPFPKPAKGFLQIGFARTRLYKTIDYRLRNVAHNWHLAESGFFFLSTVDGDSYVILSDIDPGHEGLTLGDAGFDLDQAIANENIEKRAPGSNEFLGFEKVRFFDSLYFGRLCLCTTGTVNYYHRYVAAMPYKEIYAGPLFAVAVTGGTLFIVLVVALCFMTRLTQLVVRLRGFILAEQDRQVKDLALARTIQSSALPPVFPQTPVYGIFAMMRTAREVGGDFYDFYNLPDGRTVFLVADVSGKGVPAALFMMRAKAILRTAVCETPDDLALAVARANDALAEKNEAQVFVTAWIGIYDPRLAEVLFVNAGHNPPLVRRANGSVCWVREVSGLVLSAYAGVPYKVDRLALNPGDSIFLYTDGVTEGLNEAGEQFEEDRLEKAASAAPVRRTVAAVDEALRAFVGKAEPFDDVTMLALDVKPFGPVLEV